jgi:hypothetical protein
MHLKITLLSRGLKLEVRKSTYWIWEFVFSALFAFLKKMINEAQICFEEQTTMMDLNPQRAKKKKKKPRRKRGPKFFFQHFMLTARPRGRR